MSVDVTFPTTQTSNVYGLSFKAVNRTPNGSSTANNENFRIYLDGVDITAKTTSQYNGYTPGGYNGNQPWAAQNVWWTSSDYYYSASFTITPGSKHTVTIKGMNAQGSNQTVFLDDVRVTSVDAIFAGGIPGGGEATGQPVGSNLQNTLNVEADWAKAYGLQQFAYEGGWSLGGDDGGSWVQLQAKYGDARAAAAQETYMRYFAQSGSAVDVLGTYAQWPSWYDYYAKEGLIDVSKFPIMLGVDAMANQLPADPTNGVVVPNVLTPSLAVIANASSNNGWIGTAGGYLDWNIIVPQTGSYTFKLTTTGNGGKLAFLVDDRNTVASGSSGGDLAGTITLTRGLHSVKVRSTSAAGFTVSQIAVTQNVVAAPVAPSAPQITSTAAGNATVMLNWSTVVGAAGYKVAYGSSSGVYGQPLDVGTALNYNVTGLSNGQPYFFVVYAYGNGLTSVASNQATATPVAPPVAPAAPSLSSATAGNGTVGLNWSTVVGASGYKVAYGSSSGIYGQPLDVGTALNYNVTSLSNGQPYFFVVYAYGNGLTSVASNQATATPVAPPVAPAAPSLSSATAGNGTVGLNWSTVVGASGYKVAYGSSSGVYGQPLDVGTALNYNVTSLSNGQPYFFVVYAYGNGLTSVASNQATATPVAPPVAPAAPGLPLVTAGNGAVAVDWSTVAGASGYKVAYGASSGVYGQPVDVGNGLNHYFTGLSNGQPYYFVVYAYGNGLTSVASNQAMATPVAPPVAPAAPAISSAIAGNAALSIGWSAIPTATGYRVAYGTSSGNYSTVVDAGQALTYTLSGLTNGQPYYIAVYAYAANGLSSLASAEKIATPVAPRVAPGSPTSVTAVAGNATAAVSWQAVANAIGYKVSYGTNHGIYSNTVDVGNTLSLAIPGLTNGQAYYVVAYAYASNGLTSAASVETSVTPVAPVIPATPAASGTLLSWDFQGQPGSQASNSSSSNATGTVASTLTRGPLLWAQPWAWSGDGAFAGGALTHAQSLAEAKSMGEYYQLSAAAVTGNVLALSSLQFHFFVQNHSDTLNHIALGWSTDGVNFTDGPPLALVNNMVVANLAGVSALQTAAHVTFRVYVFGNASYESSGFCSTAGSDVVLSGTVKAAIVAPTVSRAVVNGNLSALSGQQRSMVDSIVYTFTQPVKLGAGAFTIAVHNGQTGTTPWLQWSSPDGGLTWVVSFSGPGVVGNSIADGVYDITLHANAVLSMAGTPMNADRVDTFYRLFGDLQGNKTVNVADAALFNLSYGLWSGAANFLPALDSNGNSTIGSTDKANFNRNFGRSLTGFSTSI